MNFKNALKVFFEWDKKGFYVFKLADLSKLFPNDSSKTLQEGVNRLVKSGLLERVSKGVYVFAFAKSKNSNIIETIAKTLRRGKYNYVNPNYG